jgi:hypothetical protein
LRAGDGRRRRYIDTPFGPRRAARNAAIGPFCPGVSAQGVEKIERVR